MAKLERVRLERVHYMPKVLEPGLLYISEEFGSIHVVRSVAGFRMVR